MTAYKSMNKLEERFIGPKPLLVKSNVNSPESLEKYESKVTENQSNNSVVNIKRKVTEVKQAT